ncbi:hypothetical protein ACFV5G_22890 [Streptomyces sp. NPDC059766]|uniref:hypothetical protein n=1 Tax=Streptomyces sp. NPDC059766 TaxID=3346940 RepID=UPI00365B12A9
MGQDNDSQNLSVQEENLPAGVYAVLDQIIHAQEQTLMLHRFRLRQLRKMRRRARRRAALLRLQAHRRTGLFVLGSAASAAGVVCLVFGMSDVAVQLFQVAAAAWAAAMTSPSSGSQG